MKKQEIENNKTSSSPEMFLKILDWFIILFNDGTNQYPKETIPLSISLSPVIKSSHLVT